MEDEEIAAIPQDFVNKVQRAVKRNGRDDPRLFLLKVLSFFEAHGRPAEVEDQSSKMEVLSTHKSERERKARTKELFKRLEKLSEQP